MIVAENLEKENKEFIKKYCKKLFGNKYSIVFIEKEKKSNYSQEILEHISEIEGILKIVQDKLDFCHDLKSRKTEFISQKYALVYCLRYRLNYRPRAIAHVLCNKEHTIISHACRKASEWLETNDEQFTDIVFQIQNII
jgi:chromosomal replication initiation ATPase DnaA